MPMVCKCWWGWDSMRDKLQKPSGRLEITLRGQLTGYFRIRANWMRWRRVRKLMFLVRFPLEMEETVGVLFVVQIFFTNFEVNLGFSLKITSWLPSFRTWARPLRWVTTSATFSRTTSGWYLMTTKWRFRRIHPRTWAISTCIGVSKKETEEGGLAFFFSEPSYASIWFGRKFISKLYQFSFFLQKKSVYEM